MIKLLNVFLIFFLFTSNVYADTQSVGRCIGILSAKIQYEGQSAITETNRKWIQENNSSMQIVTRIGREQKDCVSNSNILIESCLSSYSNYEAQLFKYFFEGINMFKMKRYDKVARALWEVSCSRL